MWRRSHSPLKNYWHGTEKSKLRPTKIQKISKIRLQFQNFLILNYANGVFYKLQKRDAKRQTINASKPMHIVTRTWMKYIRAWMK